METMTMEQIANKILAENMWSTWKDKVAKADNVVHTGKLIGQLRDFRMEAVPNEPNGRTCQKYLMAIEDRIAKTRLLAKMTRWQIEDAKDVLIQLLEAEKEAVEMIINLNDAYVSYGGQAFLTVMPAMEIEIDADPEQIMEMIARWRICCNQFDSVG